MVKKTFLTAIIMLALSSPVFVSAQGLKDAGNILNKVADPSKTGLSSDLGSAVATVIRTVLALVGTIFLILTIYAGILWMTSQGNEDQVEKALGMIKAAVIGLVIIMSAYAITYFVTSKLAGATGTSNQPASPKACSLRDTETACASDGLCFWFVNPPPSTLPGTCLNKN